MKDDITHAEAATLFDRGGPFYPLVVHYLATLYGFKELAARGVALRLMAERQRQEVTDQSLDELIAARAEHGPEATQQVLGRMLASDPPAEYLPPLDLKSEVGRGRLSVPADVIGDELAGNATYLAETLMRAAGMLLVLAWETTTDLHDGGPMWEFLRHCRNAAAHNGLFMLPGDGPRRTAAWNGLLVTKDLDGTPLFREADQRGLLGPADAIYLLHDIEETVGR